MNKRIYLILSGENLFHPHYFEGLLKTYDRKLYKIVGVSIPKEKFKKGLLNFLIYQSNLWGPFGILFIISITILFRLLAQLNIKQNCSIQSIAKKYDIPIIEVDNVNSQKHLSYLKSLKIDIIISSNGQIFKGDLLKIPRIACINRHTALLPKYGGCMPVFWAMMHNEEAYGVSIHYMVKEIDKGDILYQETIPLLKMNSLFYNYIVAFDKSITITLKALDNLMQGKIVKKYKPNNKEYFKDPTLEYIKKIKNKNSTFNLRDIFFYFKLYHFA